MRPALTDRVASCRRSCSLVSLTSVASFGNATKSSLEFSNWCFRSQKARELVPAAVESSTEDRANVDLEDAEAWSIGTFRLRRGNGRKC